MSFHMRRIGATNDAQAEGIIDDLFNAGRGAVDAGRDELEGSAGDVAEKIIRSSQFRIVLDAVEAKAEKGVKDVVAQNAIGLVGLGIGAGMLGGAISKGKAGVFGSLVIIGSSFAWLLAVNKPAKSK